MRKHWTAAGVIAMALVAGSFLPLSANDAIRLDATSEATAHASFQKMMDHADDRSKRDLAMAMAKINLEGVQSAYEIVQRPELQTMSIGRIKDRVAGMTADEIVALADSIDGIEMRDIPTP
ncbi:hypothetical protein [Luteimonas terrae]|uniref:Uncharacterized protein n=1 Tax=Luteimonas terrae TaxID=1530191 RepID=A0ABU1XUH5_9GAMM|nr:hypothetical protein [Luteimonas terrae]MDR7192398.1 hypothetical protein [Luteimonas terrae]